MSQLGPAAALETPATVEPAAGIEPVALEVLGGAARRRVRLPLFLRLLLANPKSAFGLGLLTTIVLLALAAPLLTNHKPDEADELPFQPPSWRYPFGTTDQGYNVFSQVIWGARLSLAVAASAALIALFIATALGLLAAYKGGWIDELINTVTNIFLVIPALPLLIVIFAFLPHGGPWVMVLVIASTTWALEARVLRSQALSLRNRDFILAAKVAGESTWRIVFGEFVPNMLSRIMAGFLFLFVNAIFYEAALEFLGFGDANQVTWGTILYWAQNNSTLLQGEWWHFVFPGLAISLTVMSLTFINYGVDELSNPRLRKLKSRKRGLLRLRPGGARP